MTHRKPAIMATYYLEQLSKNSFAPDPKLAEFIVTYAQAPAFSLFERALSGFGAWCVFGLLLLLGATTNLINFSQPVGLCIWGVVLGISAIISLRLATNNGKNSQGFKQSFLSQCAFATMAGGKVLLVAALYHIMATNWAIPIGLWIVACATYPIFPLALDRFLWSFACCVSVQINFLTENALLPWQTVSFSGVFFVQMIALAICLIYGNRLRAMKPLFYALTLSLCICVFLVLAQNFSDFWRSDVQIRPYFIDLILTLSVIAICIWMVGDIDRHKIMPVFISLLGIIALGSMSASGVLFALGLLILGYGRHEKILTILGSLLMPVFLYLYFAQLDLAIWQKSTVLLGCGSLLLAGRFYVSFIARNQGEL